MTKREQQILQWIAEDPMISQEALAARAGIARSSVAVHISNLMKKGYIAGKGYVLRQADYAVVIGGVNMDIGGQSFGPLVARDSNPGAVRVSPGGVGRNIAHNMALLGLDVRMLTALGDDLYARQIAAGAPAAPPPPTCTWPGRTGTWPWRFRTWPCASESPRNTSPGGWASLTMPGWWWWMPIYRPKPLPGWQKTVPGPCSPTRYPPPRPSA